MIRDSQREILIKFGLHVEAIRLGKDLSLREVAKHCDVDYANIKKIEKGQLNMTLLTVLELAKGLGVESSELMKFKI
ncbi:MAG: helix-turn-helix transcriptional regulator [Bacteroidetes bacterium]|nr:helix-turn-helix transcriptional regulator [Bacteroidota bacterium]